MTTRWEVILAPLRSKAGALIADNAVALGLGPSGAAGADTPDFVDPGSDGERFEVALGPIAKGGLTTALRASGADKGFDRTVDRITGGSFNAHEIKILEDRALTAARLPDLGVLTGIGEGPPVVLNSTQKATIDRLMNGLGSDDLATRARAAYGKAVGGGQIKIR